VSDPLQSSWPPLVGIALLSDGNRKWGGLDFFGFRGGVTFFWRRAWPTLSVHSRSVGRHAADRTRSLEPFLVEPESYVEVVSDPGWAPLCLPTIMFLLRPAALLTPVKRGLAQLD